MSTLVSRSVSYLQMGSCRRRCADRRGTTVVETAFVLPVFLLFVFAIFEFGHAFMVVQVLKSAAQQGARHGVTEDINSDQIKQKVRDVLGGAIDLASVNVYVKDGSAFDEGSPPSDVKSLPDVEVMDLEDRELYVVYVEVPYEAVRVIRVKFLDNLLLSGQAAMRRE